MVLFPRMATFPTPIMQRTAEECGRSTARDALATPYSARSHGGRSAMLRSSRTRQKLPLCRRSTGVILAREPLTMTGAEDYIDPLGRAAAWRDGASAKPLTVYAVNHPAISYGYVGCAGFGGFPACRGRGRKASGCLKSESEERETWTAESLRAASSNGEGLA
jgi:hypothetical protein